MATNDNTLGPDEPQAHAATDLPEFTGATALGLSVKHDLGEIIQGLHRYYSDLSLALGVSNAGPPNPAYKHYHRDQVRRAALETAAHALHVIRSGVSMLTAAAEQAATADRFVKHLEAEYAADKELAAARRKRRRAARPRPASVAG